MTTDRTTIRRAHAPAVVATSLAVVLAAATVLAGGHDPQSHVPTVQAGVPGLVPGARGWAGDVEQREFRAEVSDRQSHSLALGANGWLELKTVSGDVTVVAGSGPNVALEVVRVARGRTDEDARQGLAEVRATVDHQGERATVTAVYTKRERPPYSVDVSYTVTAPPGTRVTASSVSGEVTVRRLQGEVVATSVSGDVVVSEGSRATAKSVSGDISVVDVKGDGVFAGSVSGDVRLDGIAASRLDAQSVSGEVIATRTAAVRSALKSVSGDIEYQGAIARGGRYELQSHSGDVRVRAEGPAGFELEVSTFSGTLRTEPAAVLRAATTSRRSLRGTVGDGSAVVVATTFSGDVTISTP